jgi:hypothetical protein
MLKNKGIIKTPLPNPPPGIAHYLKAATTSNNPQVLGYSQRDKWTWDVRGCVAANGNGPTNPIRTTKKYIPVAVVNKNSIMKHNDGRDCKVGESGVGGEEIGTNWGVFNSGNAFSFGF